MQLNEQFYHFLNKVRTLILQMFYQNAICLINRAMTHRVINFKTKRRSSLEITIDNVKQVDESDLLSLSSINIMKIFNVQVAMNESVISMTQDFIVEKLSSSSISFFISQHQMTSIALMRSSLFHIFIIFIHCRTRFESVIMKDSFVILFLCQSLQSVEKSNSTLFDLFETNSLINDLKKQSIKSKCRCSANVSTI